MRRPTEQQRAAIRTALERLAVELPIEQRADALALLAEAYDAAEGDRWAVWAVAVAAMGRAA